MRIPLAGMVLLLLLAVTGCPRQVTFDDVLKNPDKFEGQTYTVEDVRFDVSDEGRKALAALAMEPGSFGVEILAATSGGTVFTVSTSDKRLMKRVLDLTIDESQALTIECRCEGESVRPPGGEEITVVELLDIK